MPLSTDKIPNLPLTGTEVMNYSLALVREYCERFRAYPVKLKIDYTMRNPAMPRYQVRAGRVPQQHPDTHQVALESLLKEAKSAMTIDYVFGPRIVYPNIAYEICIWLINHDGVIAERLLVGSVDNPNLVRVNYRLPITQVEKILPTEESPFGGIRTVTMDIDQAQYPRPKSPEEIDLTPDVELLSVEAEPITRGMISAETLDELESASVSESDHPRTRRKRA